MFRCLLISSGAHLLLIGIVFILGLIKPPAPAYKPLDITKIHAIGMLPPPGGMTAKPGPIAPPPVAPPKPAPPTPAPAPPPPTTKEIAKPADAAPKPAPIVKKAPTQAAKKIIAKNKDIVESAPTPKATAAPTAEPAPAPKVTPRGTPPPVQLPGNLTPPTKATPGPMIDVKGLPSAAAGHYTGPSVNTNMLSTGGPLMELGENYAYNALYIIQQNFRPPYTLAGVSCVVEFKVMRDGTINEPKIKTPSGRSDLDQSAIRAIHDTGRLPELYDGFNKPFMEAEVTFEFEKRE